MGVADNRSYKNEYLFNDKNNSVFGSTGSTATDNPSINVDPKINTTIKENPYRSNVEIEGDEIVLQPDLSALFKAVGKKHSKGGMDVMLRPDAFVFSDYEGLNLSPKDHKLFELKEGGKNADNTPAEVLKRNVDIKHYNGMVALLGDPFKDDLAKKSAARMLEKYIATIGNIAYIQEEKKGMPQGVPAFAANTAPVYDTDLKNKLMENKQYAKVGGTIDNPYLPQAQLGGMRFLADYMKRTKAAPSTSEIPVIPLPDMNISAGTAPANNWGLWQGDKLPFFENRYHSSNAADKIGNLDTLAKQLNYNGPKDNTAFQHWLYNSSPENKAIIDKWHGTYNVGPNNGMFDGKIGIRWANALKEITGKPTPPNAKITITNPGTEEWPTNSPAPEVPNITGAAQGPKVANWNFTPWQRKSHLNDWMNYLNVDKYGADRAHYTATYASPFLVNPEQAVGDIRAVGNQQINGANVLNPILRNAQASQAYGQELNQIPGVRSQYDNQNAGIKNNFAMAMNQVKNNESLVNLQNDMNYSRDSTTAEVNYKNMKDYLKNKAIGNTMADVSTNQKLAYNLLAQNNPAYGFDWNSGNLYRNPKSILDVQGNERNDYLTELVGKQVKDWDKMDATQKNQLLKIILGSKFTPTSGADNSFAMKKGGKMAKNPYK